MKKLESRQMESLQGGRGECYIDGVLTFFAAAAGLWSGGPAGMAIGLIGGLMAGNSNGCFSK